MENIIKQGGRKNLKLQDLGFGYRKIWGRVGKSGSLRKQGNSMIVCLNKSYLYSEETKMVKL